MKSDSPSVAASEHFLIRHSGTEGDKEIAKAVGIFDTLGYHEYDDAQDLQNRLAAHIDTTHLTFSTVLDRNSRVYLIEPPNRGADVGVMVSRVKKAGYGRYRSFTPEEDSRLSAMDAIRQVGVSSGVFIPLQSPATDGESDYGKDRRFSIRRGRHYISQSQRSL